MYQVHQPLHTSNTSSIFLWSASKIIDVKPLLKSAVIGKDAFAISS